MGSTLADLDKLELPTSSLQNVATGPPKGGSFFACVQPVACCTEVLGKTIRRGVMARSRFISQ